MCTSSWNAIRIFFDSSLSHTKSNPSADTVGSPWNDILNLFITSTSLTVLKLSSRLFQQPPYRSALFCPRLSIFRSNWNNSFKMLVRLCHFSAQNLPMAFVCTKNKIQSLFLSWPQGTIISHLATSLIPFLTTLPLLTLLQPHQLPGCSLNTQFLFHPLGLDNAILPGMLFSQTTAWFFLPVPSGFCFSVTLI